jgi:hypothetical protein
MEEIQANLIDMFTFDVEENDGTITRVFRIPPEQIHRLTKLLCEICMIRDQERRYKLNFDADMRQKIRVQIGLNLLEIKEIAGKRGCFQRCITEHLPFSVRTARWYMDEARMPPRMRYYSHELDELSKPILFNDVNTVVVKCPTCGKLLQRNYIKVPRLSSDFTENPSFIDICSRCDFFSIQYNSTPRDRGAKKATLYHKEIGKDTLYKSIAILLKQVLGSRL